MGASLEQLIMAHEHGFTLARSFYFQDAVYQADMNAVFRCDWLLVDHFSRIPKVGDYFLFPIANEEIIIVRSAEDRISAYYNVCRHRGSRICSDAEGHKKLFVCPYHAWSYTVDGKLRKPRFMSDDFEPENYSLHSCHVREFHGLIFINLSAGAPPSFDKAYGQFAEALKFHGLDRAKIAYARSYPTKSNWKLVVENFLECYHCLVAHPELSSARAKESLVAFGSGPGSGDRDATAFSDDQRKFLERAAALGHTLDDLEDSFGSSQFRQIGRAFIKEGSVTETMDGEPASTLMGDLKDWDGGITTLTFNPASYLYCFNDFAVIFRFTPRNMLETDVELRWIVDENAAEGIDYNMDHLTGVLDPTLWQDKVLLERNQAGISSDHYVPGPLSMAENLVVRFHDWYFNRLADRPQEGQA